MRRLFVDVETTGLDPEGDRIVEVAAVAYEGLFKSRADNAQFHRLVNPGREVPPEAVEIHGHTTAQLAREAHFRELAPELAEFLRGAELVAHNAPFDMAFLDRELAMAGEPKASELAAAVIDTLVLANELYPSQRNNLTALAQRLGIDVEGRRRVHGALVDAEILAEVFNRMNQGQDTLDLKPVSFVSKLEFPPGKPAVVLLAPDPAAARRHAEYLAQMHAETGVRPLELGDSG